MFLTLTHASLLHLTPIYPPNNNRGQKYQSLGYEEDESEVWRYFEAERWRKDKGAWWVYYVNSVFVSVRISALHRLSLYTHVWLRRCVAAAQAYIVGAKHATLWPLCVCSRACRMVAAQVRGPEAAVVQALVPRGHDRADHCCSWRLSDLGRQHNYTLEIQVSSPYAARAFFASVDTGVSPTSAIDSASRTHSLMVTLWCTQVDWSFASTGLYCRGVLLVPCDQSCPRFGRGGVRNGRASSCRIGNP